MQTLDNAGTLIAIVDDDQSVRTALNNLLRSVNYETLLFESGEAVLQSDRLADINFMVLDVKLKGLCGIELLEQLHTAGVTIPTVFISGHADVNMQLRIARAGALSFLPKPVDVDILLTIIEHTVKACND